MKNEGTYFDISIEGHDDFVAFADTLPAFLKELLYNLSDEATYQSLDQVNVIFNLYGYEIDYDLSACITSIYPIKYNPTNLKYSWTATVKLNNGQTIDIWHTVWPTLKHCVKEIITIASDYPRHEIK